MHLHAVRRGMFLCFCFSIHIRVCISWCACPYVCMHVGSSAATSSTGRARRGGTDRRRERGREVYVELLCIETLSVMQSRVFSLSATTYQLTLICIKSLSTTCCTRAQTTSTYEPFSFGVRHLVTSRRGEVWRRGHWA